jgi:hypothetical protein
LLELPEDLVYLQRQHIIEAAKRFLYLDDARWVVEFCDEVQWFERWPETIVRHWSLPDLTPNAVSELRQDQPNVKDFYDGDIYRHWRQAGPAGEVAEKQRWLAMPSEFWTRVRYLKQMEKRAAKDPRNDHLLESLDALLLFTGF